MKICPQCHEEFIDEIVQCSDCKAALVNADGFSKKKASDLLSKEEFFASGDMVAFSEGPVAQCREVERILARAQLTSAVYPLTMSSSGSETLGTTSDVKYAVLIREADLDRARAAMEGKFHDDVAKEGRGAVHRDVINLEHAEITCPACGAVGPLKEGECGVCGLHLGVAE